MPEGKPNVRAQALFRVAIGALFAAILGLSKAGGAAELIMFEEPGCAWCAAWQEQIGGVYARTEEGHRAPLRRVDKTAERPADLGAIQGIAFTPTFVLMEDGREVGRIVGYPGENFFWPMLQDLLARLKRAPGGGESS